MPAELIYAALITGLAGGVHCLGMCGGIVALMGAAPARAAAYHAGRLCTYALFGAVAGTLGSTVLLARYVLPVQQAMYVLAGLMLVVIGVHLAGWRSPVLALLERTGARGWRLIEPSARALLRRAGPRRALLAGLAWGAVPCALVYTTLTLALLAGSAGGGALVMLAFGAGTTPHLVLGTVLARRASRLMSRPWPRRAAGLLLVALAVTGLAHEMHLGEVAGSFVAWCTAR